jgi:hypothetical protein
VNLKDDQRLDVIHFFYVRFAVVAGTVQVNGDE